EAGDTPSIDLHDAETFASRVLEKHEGRERVCFAMGFECGAQIDVGNDLAVDREKGFVVEKLAGVVESPARAENHRFFDVVQLHAKLAAVAQCRADRLWPVMQVDDDVVETVARDVLRDVPDERFAEDWNCGLGAIFSERPKTCAVTGGKNYRAHWRGAVFIRGLGSLGRRVAHYHVERAGRDFAKARIAIEGNGNADGRVLAGETETAFEEAIVDLVDVQCPTFFAQQERDCLRDGAVHETIAEHFDVVTDRGDLLASVDWWLDACCRRG